MGKRTLNSKTRVIMEQWTYVDQLHLVNATQIVTSTISLTVLANNMKGVSVTS